MKPAFHWRVALWNAVLIGLALALFGAEPRTFFLAGVIVVLSVALVWRLRSQMYRPLRDLTGSLRRTDADHPVVSAIPRGLPEVRDVVAAVSGWQGMVQQRASELSEAHRRLESVLRAMDEGVLVFDHDGRVIRSNAALLQLLDVRRDPRGMTSVELFRDEALDQAVQAALSGEEVDATEFQTGSNRILRALVSAVTRSDGQIEAAVMVLEDLTDIRQVDRIRRDFVANVSHEFKTPLTSIRGYAETMLSESSDASHRDFADAICRNARYLESLVNDLLVLARMEAEPAGVFKDVDILTLVNEQIGLRRKRSSDAVRDIRVECPSIVIHADPARLAIALSNLIDNAIRYNRPSGVVHITGGSDDTYVVLEVKDEGYGIPQDELPRIFERFYRVDKARTRDAGGTGLGLAIARHAVESQGGSLTVTSQAGVGSTFQVKLPIRTEAETPVLPRSDG